MDLRGALLQVCVRIEPDINCYPQCRQLYHTCMPASFADGGASVTPSMVIDRILQVGEVVLDFLRA